MSAASGQKNGQSDQKRNFYNVVSYENSTKKNFPVYRLIVKDEMKTIKEIEKIILSHKQELNEKYGLISIGLFGSYVRGDQDLKSDLDVLVEVRRPMGFVKFIRLENHLSQLLGVKVDLVTKKALKPHIGQRILQEVQYV